MSAKNGELRRARTEARLYRILAAVNHAVMRADTPEEVYAGLCQAAVKEGAFQLATIRGTDSSGTIVLRHAEGTEAGLRAAREVVISANPERPEGSGPTGTAWRDGRMVVVDDFQTDPRMGFWRGISRVGNFRSSVALPIRSSGKTAAVLTIYSEEPGFFTPEIAEFAQHIAREAEFALENLVLTEKVSAMGAALHESRGQLSKILNNLPSACCVMDVRERKLVFASLGIERVTGLSPARMLELGTAITERMHPDDLAANRPFEHHATLSDGEVWEWQARFRVDGGPWRWHRLRETVFERGVDGRVRLVLAVVEDIGELAVVTAEKRRVARAVEAAAESVVITDVLGNIEYVNPAFSRLTGYTREEAVGKHTRLLKSGRQDPEFYRQLWDTISSGYVWRGHLVNKRKDGTIFEEDATISPVLDEHGKVVNYVAVKRDVSKELELEKQLGQSQKLEAVGRLAGGVAHDFNNILTAILGCAELMSEDLPSASPLRADLDEIRRSGQRAADLTRQLLTFSRRQIISPRLLDPARVLGDFEKMLRRIVGEDVVLSFVHRSRGARIEADPVQLEQVVMNFVVNSRDAMPSGGEIAVELSDAAVREPLDGVDGPVPPGAYVVLSVRDTGPGIAPEVLPRIFEPFFTTKEAGVGTGLGLSTVYGIVKQARGFLVVASAVGRGTTMSVYWPAVAGAETAEEEAQPARGGTERVLLVEDEEGVRSLVERQLAHAGYRGVAAADASEALPLAAAQEFDLLLTDVVLTGGVNGKELSLGVLRARPAIKVLYMSGYSGETFAHKGVLEPGTRLLQKPFTQDMLLRAVREALDAPAA